MLTGSVSRRFVQQDLLISASQPTRPQLEKTGWSGGRGGGRGGPRLAEPADPLQHRFSTHLPGPAVGWLEGQAQLDLSPKLLHLHGPLHHGGL